MGMGKNSDMVGKIPLWKWEKGRNNSDMVGIILTWLENSDMVGKIPTWSEKKMGRGTCRQN